MSKRSKKKLKAIREAEIFIINWLKTAKGVSDIPTGRIELVELAEKHRAIVPPNAGQPRCKADSRLIDLVLDINGTPRISKKLKQSSPKGKALDKIAKFMKSAEWARLRYDALEKSDGKCQCCGRSKHDGVVLNVDHIKPVRLYWKLRADPDNHQVLCGTCNWGKGNRYETDWREPKLKTVMGDSYV